MLRESFAAAICGPPLKSNTAIPKDNAVYLHDIEPAFAPRATFKKGSTPPNCLAVSETHIFAAQQDKAYVHVYSRLRGNQEAFIPLLERVRCLTFVNQVLVMGTSEGRILLWEVCTGRLVSTPPCHVQAISCLSATPFHVITGSEDSNVHVWSLAHLLELSPGGSFANNHDAGHQPLRSLTTHRGAITALAAAPGGVNPFTRLCVSTAKDKSCVLWNYQTGEVLRTLLFPTSPMCLALDPCARAAYVATDAGAIFAIDFFAPGKHLLGAYTEDDSPVAITADMLLGQVKAEATGSTICIALSYDGLTLLTGHAKGQIQAWRTSDRGSSKSGLEMINLNAEVSNIRFIDPISSAKVTAAWNVVKPLQGQRTYTFTSQLREVEDVGQPSSTFASMLQTPGFSNQTLGKAAAEFQMQQNQQHTTGNGANGTSDQDLVQQIDDLWEVVEQSRLLQQETVEKYARLHGTVI